MKTKILRFAAGVLLMVSPALAGCSAPETGACVYPNLFFNHSSPSCRDDVDEASCQELHGSFTKDADCGL